MRDPVGAHDDQETIKLFKMISYDKKIIDLEEKKCDWRIKWR